MPRKKLKKRAPWGSKTRNGLPIHKAPTIQPTQAPSFQLHYLTCNDGTVRVWKDTWFNDQFEVLTTKQFEQLQYFAVRFSIRLNEHDEETEEA